MFPELIVLGILSETPRHGYEIKRIVSQQFEQFAEIKAGSVYYLLGKLEKEGWVEPRLEQPGPYPTRHVYEITEAGKAHYRELLKEALYAPDRPYFAFDLALCFARDLEYGDILKAVGRRRDRVARYLNQLEAIEHRYDDRQWGFNARAIKNRVLMMLEGMNGWYRDLEAEIETLMNHQPEMRPDVPGFEESLDLRESSVRDEPRVEENQEVHEA